MHIHNPSSDSAQPYTAVCVLCKVVLCCIARQTPDAARGVMAFKILTHGVHRKDRKRENALENYTARFFPIP